MIELRKIAAINMPRYIHADNASNYQLVCFCDGSGRAYAASVYLQADKEEDTYVNLFELHQRQRVASHAWIF